MTRPRLTLIGYRASGKTTGGRALASALGWRFIDLDHELTAQTGRSIRTIFAEDGEAVFRDLEERTLAATLAVPARGEVIATGGGIILRPANRRLLAERGGLVIYLRADAVTLAARLATAAGDRPSLSGAGVSDEVAEVLAQRTAHYEACADHCVDTDRAWAAVLADLVALGQAHAAACGKA